MQKALAVLFAFLLGVQLAAQDRQGSICVDLAAREPPMTAATPDLACTSGKYSFQIDDRDVTAWPREQRLKVTGLDLHTRHRVRTFCDGKPHQTFFFRFSEYQVNDLCLFINDLYQTPQLWRPVEARWIKCP